MKIKNILSSAIIAIAGTFSINAQQTSPMIEVNGSSTISIVPDRITIEIGMEEYFKTSKSDSVKVNIREIENQVRTILNKAGVADSLISISGVGNYIDRNSSVKFQMAKRLSAVLTDFAQLDKISETLPELGVTSFSIAKLDNSDMARYNREGLKSALDAAKAKADFIASNENLSGLTVWKVEETSPSYSMANAFSNVAYAGGSGMDNMRKIERRYSVKVTYLIVR